MPTSKLKAALERLSMHSIESVQDGSTLSDFDTYMHVERPIELKLRAKMQEIEQLGGGIILLVGSAGDGKSHLLSIMRKKFPESFFSYYNDATASSSPKKTSIETLLEELTDYSDKQIETTRKKLVIAINLGKLNSFINDERAKEKYTQIITAARNIFDSSICNDELNSQRIKLLRFDNEQIFEFDSSQDIPISSTYLKGLIKKIAQAKQDNPFYNAYLLDKASNEQSNFPIITNYELLQQDSVQNSIIKYVIEGIIRYKITITTRDFLDFIQSILVSPDDPPTITGPHYYDHLLPSLLFAGKKNRIQRVISNLDPMKHFCSQHEEDLSVLYNGVDESDAYFDSKGISGLPKDLKEKTALLFSDNGIDIEPSIKFIMRLQHILSYHSECPCYISYTKLLHGIKENNKRDISEIYSLVQNCAIPRHHGSYWSTANAVPLNIRGKKYQLYAKASIKPDQIKNYGYGTTQQSFFSQFTLSWDNGTYILPIDYTLYEYMYELKKGKLPTSYDTERIFSMERLIQDILKNSNYEQELLVSCPDGNFLTLTHNPNIGSITLS